VWEGSAKREESDKLDALVKMTTESEKIGAAKTKVAMLGIRDDLWI
jgi:hypothetical protein